MSPAKLDPARQISGYFIEFSDEEMSIIMDGLTELGYSQDTAGLKKYILESIMSADENFNEPGDLGERIGVYIRQHPELILKAGKLAGSLFKRKAGSR